MQRAHAPQSATGPGRRTRLAVTTHEVALSMARPGPSRGPTLGKLLCVRKEAAPVPGGLCRPIPATPQPAAECEPPRVGTPGQGASCYVWTAAVTGCLQCRRGAKIPTRARLCRSHRPRLQSVSPQPGRRSTRSGVSVASSAASQCWRRCCSRPTIGPARLATARHRVGPGLRPAGRRGAAFVARVPGPRRGETPGREADHERAQRRAHRPASRDRCTPRAGQLPARGTRRLRSAVRGHD